MVFQGKGSTKLQASSDTSRLQKRMEATSSSKEARNGSFDCIVLETRENSGLSDDHQISWRISEGRFSTVSVTLCACGRR